MQGYGQTDAQTDMTKVTALFPNFSNVPEIKKKKLLGTDKWKP